MYQRSCDFALGVPVNLASMSLLLMIIAKTCNMIPRQSKWSGGDVHIYLDHIEGLKEQLSREKYPLPQVHINKNLNTLEDILSLNVNDFELVNYQSNPKINFELFVGLK
jgi:thymidylate synthase